MAAIIASTIGVHGTPYEGDWRTMPALVSKLCLGTLVEAKLSLAINSVPKLSLGTRGKKSLWVGRASVPPFIINV